METGIIYPQTEIKTGPRTARTFAEAAESAGYDHLQAYDHVLGVDPSSRSSFSGYFDYRDSFHEPLTLFSYLAGITDDITFVSGILILPQRQTALVAKQCAEVDILSDGRFVLGAAVGWNEAEYLALGEDFSARGQRIEEQLTVLRSLWTESAIDYHGEYHDLPSVGINPLPTQQPIPVWIGGGAPSVRRRVAERSNGWIVPKDWKEPDSDLETFESALEEVYDRCKTAGRDPSDLDIVGRTRVRSDDPDDWVERALEWKQAGATHLALSTMESGLETSSEHIDLMRCWKTALDEAGVTN